jgi:hypothetical protein
VWTTDKDRIIPASLAAEIAARMDRYAGAIFRELTIAREALAAPAEIAGV